MITQHCDTHKQFEYDCIDCDDARRRASPHKPHYRWSCSFQRWVLVGLRRNHDDPPRLLT